MEAHDLVEVFHGNSLNHDSRRCLNSDGVVHGGSVYLVQTILPVTGLHENRKLGLMRRGSIV
jgi:hypothetical protein